ncbi:alanine dehydrogenase [Thermanaerovibrio acidaminovorans]|jgi:alanine dehydrogenase|uniref:Alanine dehydrogenase n=1 Tax=Thermanaerovibrio acidaminovorans (strain ATCC 49978 / DSM 6589 / Su883) TaxID=525903 RepID=D1B5S2_THEAS|nr:alanine dehydrogenase [Thermanaerovibrio acidaminovorans]ACZ19363.1 alanine dehydrogenase [Thermanaerovibrio acidaminovorans DSM 6589]
MKIGCPKEIKNHEYRVGLIPASVRTYVASGHEVFVQKGAGLGSGIADEEYVAAGAKILDTAEEVWAKADMIVKVKEPLPQEYPLMREGQLLYTYFHFAASEELTKACMERKIVALAYETVEDQDGSLPLLKPMSEVAGRMAPLMGSFYLGKAHGGRGLLVSGVPGVAPCNVLVLGGGVVGRNAARMAAGLGAKVTILDVKAKVLEYLDDTMPSNVFPVYSDPVTLEENLKEADMVIGAVLIPGAKAPKLVRKEHLKIMKPGAVMVDVAIDQGGCFETSHATTHSDPIYVVDGIVHYCVANMPGAYARTSTFALNNATIYYGKMLADKGYIQACKDNPGLKKGLNMVMGKVTYKPVAEAFDLPYTPVDEVL